MESDNLYPNDSTYFLPREPAEQIIDRKKERAKTLEHVKLLEELVERFETQINFLNSVDSMPDAVKTDPAKFMNVHNSHDLSMEFLRGEKSYIEGLLDNSRRKES